MNIHIPPVLETRCVSEDEPDTSSLTRRVSINHCFQVIASCTTENVTASSGYHLLFKMHLSQATSQTNHARNQIFTSCFCRGATTSCSPGFHPRVSDFVVSTYDRIGFVHHLDYPPIGSSPMNSELNFLHYSAAPI